MKPLVAAVLAAALLLAAPAAAQSPVIATVDGMGEIMQLLLQNLWVLGEAAERGVVVTDEQVEREFEAQKRQTFGSEREFRRFLRTSGFTVADIKFRVRLEQH